VVRRARPHPLPFAYPFVTEVLTLPGVRASSVQSARNTALSIYAKAREGGLYTADWNGVPNWANACNPSKLAQCAVKEQIYTTAGGVNMVIAGAALP